MISLNCKGLGAIFFLTNWIYILPTLTIKPAIFTKVMLFSPEIGLTRFSRKKSQKAQNGLNLNK